MLNTNELEKKWLHYKIKSYIPHATIVISSIIIVVIVSTFDYVQTNNTTQNKNNTSLTASNNEPLQPITQVQEIKVAVVEKKELNETPQQKQKETSAAQQEIIKPIETLAIESKTVIEPSLNFIDRIRIASISQPQNVQATPTKTLQSETINAPVVEAPAVEVVEEESKVIKKEKEFSFANKETKNSLNIKRNNSQEDINLVIKRFKKSNDPTLGLFIAKYYYDAGDYNLAYNYALITNQLDNNIEACWIIFTKSLVKLDQKDKAIQTLKDYIKHSHSSNAQTLLDEIVTGGMK